MSKREQELEGKYFMDKLERGRKIAEGIGLKRYSNGMYDSYDAADIHRLLGEGVEKFGRGGLYQGLWTDRLSLGSDTHKGILIAIRPIVQETREQRLEKALKEMIDEAACRMFPGGVLQKAKDVLNEGAP